MNSEIIPKFTLAAQPTNKFDLENFFNESPENFFFEKLKNPPHLRYTGWNLLTLDYPKIKNGTFWEVKNGERKTIRLYRDGALVAIGDANEEFLGWGSDKDKYIEYPKLLALALIEYVFEFVRLYKECLSKCPPINQVIFKFGFKNVDTWEGKRLILKPSRAGEFLLDDWSGDGTERNLIARDITREITVSVTDNGYDSEQVAYQILSEIFAVFGISPEKIPYMKDSALGKVVDSEQIRNIQ